MKSSISKLPNSDSLKYYKENHTVNDDIAEENKIEEEKKIKNGFVVMKDDLEINSLFENKNKKIFLVHKRLHSDDINGESQDSLTKTTKYKVHDRNEKDNIITKIQIHYRNFLIDFINEVIQKVIFEDCYKTKKLDKLLHLEEYLFNKIDRHFKSNIKKDNMKIIESKQIKEIISPSVSFCKKYNIENTNQDIMANVESLNNSIVNKTLKNKYLYFFDIYFKGERNLQLKEGKYSIDLELSHNIKLFNDLVEKYRDDEKYIANLKKFAVLNFYKFNKEEK